MSDISIPELKARIEKLEKMNATKSDMISISAHQLRTSLSALKWILKMLIDGDLGEMARDQEGFVKKAYESNERMIVLVNDLLSFNHVEDTHIKYHFELTNLIEMIDSIVFEFEGESHKKGMQIIFLEPDQTIEAELDRKKIRVVLQNLVENALKYSDSGDKIFISAENINGHIEISVKDTGIGISEDDKPKIFDKFFRAQNAKDKEDVGSGLGLITTKNIIERHGGKIWFDSIVNKGTTFHVSLPKSTHAEQGH